MNIIVTNQEVAQAINYFKISETLRPDRIFTLFLGRF